MTGIPWRDMTMRDAERMERGLFLRAEREHNGHVDAKDVGMARPERTPEQLREYAKWAEERAVELQGEIDRGEQPRFRMAEVARYRQEVQRHLDLADERENQ